MAFRDDLSAAQARAEALEREVAGLRAENEQLKQTRSPTRLLAPLSVGVLLVGAGAAFAAFALGQPAVAVAIVSLVITSAVVAVVLANLVEVVPPGFALVISGRPHISSDGQRRGYRVVTSGRVVRVPIIESANRVDLRPSAVRGRVRNVAARGGRQVAIRYAGTVAMSSSLERLERAIERFLGRDQSEIDRVASETLEGHIRGAAAQLEMAQLQSDQEAFVDEVQRLADEGFARLGLEFDVHSLEIDAA